MTHETRYMVGHGWADSVSDRTALPHRVLRIDAFGDVTVCRHYPHGEESMPILQMSGAELRYLAREARRAARRRLWAKLFGSAPRRSTKTPDPHNAEKMREARAIRELFEPMRREDGSPMRREDGSLDATKVAMETTMRQQRDLPRYIAELDGPGKVR